VLQTPIWNLVHLIGPSEMFAQRLSIEVISRVQLGRNSLRNVALSRVDCRSARILGWPDFIQNLGNFVRHEGGQVLWRVEQVDLEQLDPVQFVLSLGVGMAEQLGQASHCFLEVTRNSSCRLKDDSDFRHRFNEEFCLPTHVLFT
jgi:hypothetical protein